MVLELELGCALLGAGVADSLSALDGLAAQACPAPEDKWVVKSPFGFAARGRVLGRGPRMDPPSALWASRRFERGERLLFEPWLDVRREYGVQIVVGAEDAVEVVGFSRMLANGAGVSTGFLLGDPPDQRRRTELASVAVEVGRRLLAEGYRGPANVDALEHSGGLRPLVEINARYTMGLVALAAEKLRAPATPQTWTPNELP